MNKTLWKLSYDHEKGLVKNGRITTWYFMAKNEKKAKDKALKILDSCWVGGFNRENLPFVKCHNIELGAGYGCTEYAPLLSGKPHC